MPNAEKDQAQNRLPPTMQVRCLPSFRSPQVDFPLLVFFFRLSDLGPHYPRRFFPGRFQAIAIECIAALAESDSKACAA